MLINGIQLSSLGASLYDRVLSSNDVETTQDWLDGDLQPTFVRQQDTFKNIVLKFLITEQNEEDAFVVMSNLSMLLKKATIIFDDMNLQFDVTMNGAAPQERLKNGNFIYTVNLKSDYAKGEAEVHTTDTAATDSFKLTVAYYKDTTNLIATEQVTIKASSFDSPVVSLEKLATSKIISLVFSEIFELSSPIMPPSAIISLPFVINISPLVISISLPSKVLTVCFLSLSLTTIVLLLNLFASKACIGIPYVYKM